MKNEHYFSSFYHFTYIDYPHITWFRFSTKLHILTHFFAFLGYAEWPCYAQVHMIFQIGFSNSSTEA